MTYLVERLAELRRHLDHPARSVAASPPPKTSGATSRLHNDVLFSLLMVCQNLIDLAGEICSRRGLGRSRSSRPT